MTVSAYRKVPSVQAADLVRLNLGSGPRKRSGFINLDSNPAYSPDIVRDLCRGLPFSDNAAWEIFGADFLEHLPSWQDLVFVLNECHRVLVPDGSAVFRVPNALSKAHPEWAFGDPTHTRFFVPHTFDYWQAGHEQHEFNGKGYGILPWRVQIVKLDEDATLQVTMQPVKEGRR